MKYFTTDLLLKMNSSNEQESGLRKAHEIDRQLCR